MFEGQLFAEIIVHDAQQKKNVDYVHLSYDAMVREIASWLRSWLHADLPKPSELVALLTDAFLLVMKTQRKKLTYENFFDFQLALEADVMRYLAKEFEKTHKGIKTSYKMRK